MARGEGVAPGVAPGATPPPTPSRASGEKGGVAPVLSLSAGAARVGRFRTKNPNRNSGKWKVVLLHPHLVLCCTPPLTAQHFARPPTVTPTVTPERGVSGREQGITRPPLAQRAGPSSRSQSGHSSRHGPLYRLAVFRVPTARVRLTDVPPVANSAHRYSGWLVSVTPFPRRCVPPLGVVDGPQVASRGRRLFSVNYQVSRVVSFESATGLPQNDRTRAFRFGARIQGPWSGAFEMGAAGATGRWSRSSILVEPDHVRRDLVPRVDCDRRPEGVLG